MGKSKHFIRLLIEKLSKTQPKRTAPAIADPALFSVSTFILSVRLGGAVDLHRLTHKRRDK